ncbi:MAG: SPFH domain-containing protein [bacterium]|nr:SPFH domain-containing protein [bacterium]
MPETNVVTSNTKPETDWRIKEISGLKKKINITRSIFLLIFAADLLFIFTGFFLSNSFYSVVPTWFFFFVLVSTLFGWYATHCLKFVKAWEKGVVFRLGKMLPKPLTKKNEKKDEKDKKKDKSEEGNFFNKVIRRIFKNFNPQDPGPVWVFYPFEKLVFVPMWTRAEDLEPRKIITKDLIEATLDILLYWKVTDACDFVIKAEDPIPMAAEFTWATLRSEVGSRKFKEVYSAVAKINTNLQIALAAEGYMKEIDIKKNISINEINDKLEEKLKTEDSAEQKADKNWGLEIKTVMIQAVIPPPGYSEAMLNLAVATQNAEAVRKTAAGKKDADIMVAEANEFTLKANARGKAEDTKLQVAAFGPDGAKILATTMIAGMVQKGDKFFIDPNAAGVSGLAALVKETLDSVGKKGG